MCSRSHHVAFSVHCYETHHVTLSVLTYFTVRPAHSIRRRLNPPPFLKEFNVLDTQPAEYQLLTAETISSNQTAFWLGWTTLFLGVLLLLAVMMCLSQRADYTRRLKAATATAYGLCSFFALPVLTISALLIEM